MEKSKIIDELNLLIDKGNDILKTEYSMGGNGIPTFQMVNDEQFTGWRTSIKYFLSMILEKDNPFFEPFNKTEHSRDNTLKCLETLKSIKYYAEKNIISPVDDRIDCDLALENIFSRFHQIVRQLRSRHDNRPTLDVNDEYDVQDLTHALLHIYFDDIRPEEWTPSYAGKSARTDFLLKKEKIFVEIKKTRKGLADKDVGEQLTLDIAKYKSHPDCEKLYCFIYDPEGRIVNKNGLIADLESSNGNFVKVIIKPE